jgi:hypothetical protein
MWPRKASGPGASDAHEARRDVRLGRLNDTEANSSALKTQVIRAELIGSHACRALGITVSGRNAPVLALCRALIKAGHDPDTALEAYRGDTLCLRVRSLGKGAKLTVRESTNDGRPRFAPYRAFQNEQENSGGRPSIEQTAEEAAR